MEEPARPELGPWPAAAAEEEPPSGSSAGGVHDSGPARSGDLGGVVLDEEVEDTLPRDTLKLCPPQALAAASRQSAGLWLRFTLQPVAMRGQRWADQWADSGLLIMLGGCGWMQGHRHTV